ncbi:RidA family protein [Halostella pelagica]|uniref:RidA family protein n=1 Tax=Halostella pelagica TaxID=2583824 RepID=UPI001081155E|nr:RidA family protein [Halostella pelagica]
MERETIQSGTEWESTVGYSRAVRAGNEIHVSGTTATDDAGDLVGIGDPYAQTAQALSNVERALERLDATCADVVRTRLFVTDVDRWDEIGRAHREYFDDVRPATSMVQVERLVDPEMVVEVEAVAKVKTE